MSSYLQLFGNGVSRIIAGDPGFAWSGNVNMAVPGTIYQFFAASAWPTKWLFIHVFPILLAEGHITLYTGAPGAEVAFLSIGTYNAQWMSIPIQIFIPAGSRISMAIFNNQATFSDLTIVG